MQVSNHLLTWFSGILASLGCLSRNSYEAVLTVSLGPADQAISKGGGCETTGFLWGPLEQPQLKFTMA